jgi:hypothetical protein
LKIDSFMGVGVEVRVIAKHYPEAYHRG